MCLYHHFSGLGACALIIASCSQQPSPRPATRRSHAAAVGSRRTNTRPRPKVRQHKRPPQPYVSVLPGARLYARPDPKAPYVRFMGDFKSGRHTGGCGRLTDFPRAMRALQVNSGWVQVQPVGAKDAPGQCIDSPSAGKLYNFRAWVRRADLGAVVIKASTGTYGKGLKVTFQPGTAAVAQPGRPGHYCVTLEAPDWIFRRRGSGNYVVRIPTVAMGHFYRAAKLPRRPPATHRACLPNAGPTLVPCPMRAYVHSPRPLGASQHVAWMDGPCVQNEVIFSKAAIKKLAPGEIDPSALTGLGGLGLGGGGRGGGGGGGGPSFGGRGRSGGPRRRAAGKPKPHSVPTLLAQQVLYWTDGTPAGQVLKAQQLDLTQTFWAKGRLCTRHKLGVGPATGFCFDRKALRIGPLASGERIGRSGTASGRRKPPKASIVSLSGAAAAQVKKAVKGHLGQLEHCHQNVEKTGYGSLSITAEVKADGSLGRVAVTAAGNLAKPVARCAATLLRLLKLGAAPSGPVRLALKLAPGS